MKVNKLIEHLSELPPDYDVCFSALMEYNDNGEWFTVIMDNPVIGTAVNENSREARFVCKHVEGENPLGKVVTFEDE